MNLIYSNFQCNIDNLYPEINGIIKAINIEKFKYLQIKIVFKLNSENNFDECITFYFGTFSLNSNLILLELSCKLYNFFKNQDIHLLEILNYDLFVYIK